MWKKYRRKIVKREESSLTDVLRSRSLTLCQRRICRERIDFSLPLSAYLLAVWCRYYLD